MPDTEILTLPLLPLTNGVVLPQMVVTLAVESPEARDAAAGALTSDRRVLLVPRVGSGYTRIGTIARVENEGELPGGDDIGALADTAGWSPDLSIERKIELLETLDPESRLEKALTWAREALA